MMRVVVDTNIVVSAFLWGGNPRAILDAARRQDITLFTSAALIAELEDVLAREKFAQRVAQVGSSVAQLVGDYLALAHLVLPTSHPSIVRDPDDDHVLACALAAQAEIIVSRDNDLLTLAAYQGIPIVKAVEALQRIEALK
jgi:putative PIN family toxin of toxin-antitoxin system